MLKKFLHLEASSAIILMIATILALIAKNSGLACLYERILSSKSLLNLDPTFVVNDFFMAFFFLLVGLEIKREFLEGSLRERKLLILPFASAIFGVVIPISIYVIFNWNNKLALNGWAIPAATDIAFALGILKLSGDRVPHNLKTSLLTIAIIDDIIGVLIITFSCLSKISFAWLGLTFLTLLLYYFIYIKEIKHIIIHIILGLILWTCLLKAGIHPTIAGIIIPFFLRVNEVKILEQKLHMPVSFIILPIFAFFNAGVSLKNFSFSLLSDNITLGITLGLFLGKQIGVMFGAILVIKILKLTHFPAFITWSRYYGMSIITGIGFTMSLFLGNLAFVQNAYLLEYAKAGILLGSFFSALLGYLFLLLSEKYRN